MKNKPYSKWDDVPTDLRPRKRVRCLGYNERGDDCQTIIDTTADCMLCDKCRARNEDLKERRAPLYFEEYQVHTAYGRHPSAMADRL